MKKINQQSVLNNPWTIFFVTALGVCMASIDGSIVNVALPTLVHSFHTTLAQMQWVISGYVLMICVFLPLSGYLSDIFTKRTIYLLGFLIFTISSALCGISTSLVELVIFRLMQGVGASMIFSNNSAILMTTFPKHLRSRALGINAMLVAIGSVAGPGLGGLLLGLFSWRAIFYINIPLGILGCYIGNIILPREERKSADHFDYFGTVLFGIMMATLVLVLSEGSSWGWFSPLVDRLLLVVFFAFCVFIVREYVARSPLIDLSIFKIWAYSSGIIAGFILFIALTSNLVLLPFYLQEQQHITPQLMGIVLLIAPFFIIFVAPVSGLLADRMNQAILTGAGLCIVFIGLFNQAFITSSSHLYTVMFDQALIGIGCGLFTSPNNYSMLSRVPGAKLGIANGVASLTRNTGKVFGVALATSIFITMRRHVEMVSVSAHKDALAFSSGFRTALLLASFLVFCAIVLTFARYKHLAND